MSLKLLNNSGLLKLSPGIRTLTIQYGDCAGQYASAKDPLFRHAKLEFREVAELNQSWETSEMPNQSKMSRDM